MAHKYHLDPYRKVDASTQGLGNHHTLFDFETMSEFYVKQVYADKEPDLGQTVDDAVRLVVDQEPCGSSRENFVDHMRALTSSFVDAAVDYAEWPDLHVYVTQCPVTCKRPDGTATTFKNTLVFGDPPEHKIVEWRIDTDT